MADMGMIGSVTGSLKIASDIAKALIDIRDAALLQSKVIELQRIILSAQNDALSAQADQFSLLERIREAEKTIADLKAWDGEKERYELKQLYRGPFAFILKEGKENGEDVHALCANCYQKGLKSYLQMSGHVSVHERTWDCPSCRTSFKGQWSSMSDWIKKTRNPAA